MFTLLAERGLLVTKRKRRGCVTTMSRHRFKKYPNVIRDFIPIAPNQLWVDNLKPADAHLKTGVLKKRWKNYWKTKKVKEVIMV